MSCVISDAVMGLAVAAAEVVGVRSVVFRASSACCDLSYKHCRDLVERGIVPLKGKICCTKVKFDYFHFLKNAFCYLKCRYLSAMAAKIFIKNRQNK